MFGSLGFPEIIFILVLALLVFGPKKLPEVGRTIGGALREFRRATGDLKRTFDQEVNLDPAPARPAKSESESEPEPSELEVSEAEASEAEVSEAEVSEIKAVPETEPASATTASDSTTDEDSVS